MALVVKNLCANAGDSRDMGSIPGLGSPRGGSGNPVQHSLPGESHRERSLAGYSPWGHKESDTAEQLSSYLFFGCTESLLLHLGFLELCNQGLLFIMVGELLVAVACPVVACGL